MPLPTPADPIETWEQFALLTFELLREPSSHLFAAVNGWQYPTTWEHLTLLSIIDMLRAEGTKAQPRPWDKPETAATEPLHAEVMAALTALN